MIFTRKSSATVVWKTTFSAFKSQDDVRGVEQVVNYLNNIWRFARENSGVHDSLKDIFTFQSLHHNDLFLEA